MGGWKNVKQRNLIFNNIPGTDVKGTWKVEEGEGMKKKENSIRLFILNQMIPPTFGQTKGSRS